MKKAWKQPQEEFYTKAALKNFAIFTGKNLCCSHRPSGRRQACNSFKKRLQYRRFFVNDAKFLRTSILKNISKWLILKALAPVMLSNESAYN